MGRQKRNQITPVSQERELVKRALDIEGFDLSDFDGMEMQAITEQTIQYSAPFIPAVVKTLLLKALDGNMQAIKFALERLGGLIPKLQTINLNVGVNPYMPRDLTSEATDIKVMEDMAEKLYDYGCGVAMYNKFVRKFEGKT